MYADTDDLKKMVLRDIGEDAVYDLERTNIEVIGGAIPTTSDGLVDEILSTSITTTSDRFVATASTSARIDATASTSARIDATASTSTATASSSTRVDPVSSSQSIPSRRLSLLAKKQEQYSPGAPTVVTFQTKLVEEFERSLLL